MHALELAAPRFEDARPLLIAGLVERHAGTAALPSQWQRFSPHIGNVPGQVGRVAYGVVFNSDREDGFDYLAGVEVLSVAGLPEEFEHLRLPAQQYAVFSHDGHVSTLSRTVEAICHEWLPASGREQAPGGVDFFERYGEAFDPHTGMGGIEIWLPVSPET